MRIAILGAGGIGAYYGAALARAGNAVELLARGEHLRALREQGLEVADPDETWHLKLPATNAVADLRGAALALVSVKSYGLESIAPAAADLARNGAVILPLLNGVDAADTLVRLGVPRAQILGGLTVISAEKTGPGKVARRSRYQRVVVGELDGGLSSRASEIATLFSTAGVDARATAEMALELWRKFELITTLAAGCGLSRTAVGALRTAPLGRALLEHAAAESVAVGRARTVPLADDEEARVMSAVDGVPDGMKPSFLLDVERGGPTELDVLSGAVSRMGHELSVPTPVHDVVVAAISAGLGIKGVVRPPG
jgi:2-dehydropantoate 2-reductase